VAEGLAHLWAGWRDGYISSANANGRTDVSTHASDDCVFCRILASGLPDSDTLIVAHGTGCVGIMNRYPYTSGHMMVIPRRHVANIGDLDSDESAELWLMINQGDAAVRTAFDPDGVNIGVNQGRAAGAGIPAHLHVHIVPRWASDTNFMTTIAETRVIPEPLDRSHQRLSATWQSLLLRSSTTAPNVGDHGK
jgi:diadenosine tetraphosphate (Ap4A) HIT family hydrolase